MRIVPADEKSEQKEYLNFRKKLYQTDKKYIDNNYFMIQEIFHGKLNFIQQIKIYPLNVKDDNDSILCQGIIAFAPQLPEYIQLCFFESLPGQEEAVSLLVSEVIKKGLNLKCKRMVIGLCGHVNYGLGFLDSHFDEVNSFSSNGNPDYYNSYFRNLKCEEIRLNSYRIDHIDHRLNRYRALINKLNKSYEFRAFDKKRFSYYSKIYTDLNNECFANHRYYYERSYKDDYEMLKELFLFMKEDSLIFAFYENKPVGFIMWYPDYNELARRGDIFGAKHFIKNIFMNKKITTAKVMEFGITEPYKKVGLPLALLNQVYNALEKYGCIKVETSWILDENLDSNSVCKAVCDEKYKGYVVYEKEI